MTMDELKPGQSAYISAVGGTGALRHHLLDMGLTPQTEITLQKVAPMGDPVQFQRDTQKILQPRGFKIGVKGDSYKISAVAKDAKKTPVYYSSGQ